METEKSIKIAKILAIPIILFLALLLVGDWILDSSEVRDMEGPEPCGPGGFPDPAVVYCKELGYTLEPSQDGRDSLCVFPDGSRCQMYDFFNGKCGQQWANETGKEWIERRGIPVPLGQVDTI